MIFTTRFDGSEVRYNQFANRRAVYLDGGAGRGAPLGALGLEFGTYVFQVTNAPGTVLLSQDAAKCRQVTVASGVITGVVATGCQHPIGTDAQYPPARPVQLFPFDNTARADGIFKVWLARVEDYRAGCAALGIASGLEAIDCGIAAGNFHGFVPANSKTDNFQVNLLPVREIDTRFFRDRNGDGHRQDNEEWLDGFGITWFDPLGTANGKWTYLNTNLDVHDEAHVEAVENGVHLIRIDNQAGCTVGRVHVQGVDQAMGPQAVAVRVRDVQTALTVFVDVACRP